MATRRLHRRGYVEEEDASALKLGPGISKLNRICKIKLIPGTL